MNAKQIEAINVCLKSVKTAAESMSATVRSIATKRGDFKITVSRGGQSVTLAHGFSLHDDTTQKSATVDILFKDTSLTPSEYIITMTEGEVDDYPWNIQEGQRLMTAFLNGQFEKRLVKVFFLSKREDLWFTADNLTYVDATPLR